MRFSLTMVLTLAIAIMTSLLVIAVIAAAQDVEKPPSRAYDPGHCYEYEVKMLTAATEVGNPDQESYLRAADAYARLDALEQKC